MSSTRIAFADESGTHAGSRCYGIGVVSVQDDKLDAFNAKFDVLVELHNIAGEMKWENVSNRFSDVNFVLDWARTVIRSRTAFFDVIVVNTSLYRIWRGTTAAKELAFYKTYTQLLAHMADRTSEIAEVRIDDRRDTYKRHPEVVEKIGNYMLAKNASAGRLKNVRKVDSYSTPGIQVADLLTGLIVAAHQRRLDPSTPLSAGKRLAIRKVASLFGWEDLCFDTMPNSRFNIWHFPQEWRSIPATREVSCHNVPYATKAELKEPITHE